MDLSFCKLRNKDVVNICDGKNLGNITDMIIDTTCGKVLGLIVPANKNFFNIFKSNNDIFIPYNRICKIGKDIILVDIIMQQNICCQPVTCFDCNNSKTQNQNFSIQSILNDIDNNNSR